MVKDKGQPVVSAIISNTYTIRNKTILYFIQMSTILYEHPLNRTYITINFLMVIRANFLVINLIK